MAELERKVAALTVANGVRASEAQLRLFVEQLPVAVAMFDRDMRYLAASRRWVADFELGDVDPTGCSHYAVFPDLPERWREVHQRGLAGEVVTATEDRWDRSDGSTQWLRWDVWPWRASDGSVGGISIFAEDITVRKRAEEQLRRNRDTFSHLIQNNPFGIYVVDADFHLWQVSQGAQKVFESVRPLLGRDFAEVLRILWPEPLASEVIARFRHTLDTGEPYGAPTTLERRADIGELESYDWRIERVELPDGRFGVVCYFYDLSERQRWEAALQQSESFHRQTLESIPGMVFTTTPEGACDYMSEQWVELTGVSAADLLGDGWVRILHPEDRVRVFAAWRAAVEGRGPLDMEYRVRRADGVYEWFKVRGRAIRDASGAVARWFGAVVNIDDLKRAEAALVARERELQTLADNTPDILTRFDRDLRLVFVNAAVERAIGRKPEQLLGKTSRELGMPADLCDPWEAAIVAVFEQRRPQSLELAWDAPDGPRYYAARLIPELGPGGEVEHVLGVTHDVTDRTRAEQVLKDADRRKDEFLATLAHELRNPLAPIRTGLEILRRGRADDDAVAKARDVMERQLGHLVRLVDDLLDVSRISRGMVELKPERVQVKTILAHAVETSRPLVEAGRHILTVQAPDEPVWVDGDLTRLAQVVGNLLNNAAKYTPSGGHIELAAGVEHDEAVIRVADDGIGIAPDMLPRVFGLFAQVDRTQGRAQGGLGIGLSLVRTLVEMHGGTIEAQSPGLGRGSTFTVRLPLASVGTPVHGGEPREPAPSHASGRRVLVVDDNADAAETLAMLLELSGHETTTAASGPEALETARTWQPELVFLDIGLPGMDGYEVARRLRADPATTGVTLVALTGWGSEDDKRKSEEAGFDLHLTKPIGPEALAAVFGVVSPSRPRRSSTGTPRTP